MMEGISVASVDTTMMDPPNKSILNNDIKLPLNKESKLMPPPPLPKSNNSSHCSIQISCSNKMKLILLLSTTCILLFMLLFFIMLGGAHIHVSIRDPTIVDFQVISPAATASSNASANAADNSTISLNTDVVMSMDVKNPTPDWGIYYYEALKWRLLYQDMSIASGMLPPFSQGPHAAQHTHRIRLRGMNVIVPPSLAFNLQSNHSTLNMEAGTSFYVHLKGSFIKFGFVIHCNLTFPPPFQGYTRLPKAIACLVADQDRGHY